MPRHTIAATAALALFLTGAAGADDKPAPPSTKSSLPSGLSAIQKPDLAVSFEGSGPGLPTGFTVRNIGNVDSKLSVLKVTATLVPLVLPSGNGTGWCPPFFSPEDCANMLAFAEANMPIPQPGSPNGLSNDAVKKACGNPFKDVLEAVPVLKPGESKTFKRDVGPYQVALTGLVQQTTSVGSTHLKRCSPTLVCAWDVTAVADASNDNDEKSRANNTATKRSVREVTFK
jgi:hypothetical protein